MSLITIRDLLGILPQTGTVEWIGIRPARNVPVATLNTVRAIAREGLEGDHYRARDGKRQVTLIQGEHLDAMASFLHQPSISPAQTRRNLVVRGINLLALKNSCFSVGPVLLQYTGPCAPCTKMEEILGPGTYNAMRGHGGITARILKSGEIKLGDPVKWLEFST